MSSRRVDIAVALVALVGLVALVVGSRWADRASLQARYDAWQATGERPEAPPAVSGATRAAQEAF